MDSIIAAKKKKRNKRRKRFPPPIFNREPSPSNNFANLPSTSSFSRNLDATSDVFLYQKEMLNRFNELLDWKLPAELKNPQLRFSDKQVSGCIEKEREQFQRDKNLSYQERQLDSYDLRNRISRSNKRTISDQDCHNIYEKDHGFDRIQKDDRHDFYEKQPNMQTAIISDNFSPISKPGFLNANDRGERRADDHHNFIPNDSSQFVDRHVKEYLPRRGIPLKEQPSFSGLRVDYSNERGFAGNESEMIYERREASSFRQFQNAQGDHYSREPIRDARDRFDSQKRWDHDQYTDNYLDQMPHNPTDIPRYNCSNNEQMPAGLPNHNFRDNHLVLQDADTRQNQYSLDESYSPNEVNDLTVVIHKINFEKITIEEAQILRNNLIDLVVNCGGPDEMPEFVSTGVRQGGSKFYVNCRTLETLHWLMQQSLPPLNGAKLSMSRDKPYQIVKISSFAQRCTRSEEDILKLLRLQNCKKGFNFDKWMMVSYTANPKGIYFAFTIPIEDANLLNDLGCQLSFELKSLTFKIAPRSVRTYY